MDLDERLQEATERAIRYAKSHKLPESGPNNAVFVFCQFLLGAHNATACLAGDLQPYAKKYIDACLEIGHIEDKEFAMAAFHETWDHDKPKYAKCDSLEESIREAKDLPVRAEVAEQFEDGRFRTLAMVCWVLSTKHADGRFFLSCRDAGRVMGMSSWGGQTAIHYLCRCGVIAEVQVADKTKRRARFFIYTGKPNLT